MGKKDYIDRIEKLIKDMAIPSYLTSQLSGDLSKNYFNGVDTIEKLINQNIVNVNQESLSFLKKYSFDLVKGVNGDLANKLRDTLSRSIMNGESYTTIQKDIKGIFDTTIERARTIARTETNRAYSVGQLNAAKNSPVKLLKYIVTVEDKRRSALCSRLARKYTRDNAIPVDQYFKDNITGEKWLTTPFHPNERSRVVFIPKEEK